MLNEKENLRVLNKRISNFNLTTKTVIAFDFDELLVPVHLCRKVTDQISKPIDSNKLVELGSDSLKGIDCLRSLYYGQDYSNYEKVLEKEAKNTPFTPGFKELLIELNKTYSIIIITAGLKDVCLSKLREINFNENNVIGGEIETLNGKITGSILTLSDELKGHVVKSIRKEHFVIAVGHSNGDKYMLREANESIAINTPNSNLAKHYAKNAKEVKQIIEKNNKFPYLSSNIEINY